MPQISVTIAGRPYRMACGEGEETHLRTLAGRLDDKITELRGDFGEIGDQRITVMAAITIADALSEAERRIAGLKAEIAALHEEREAADAKVDALGDTVAAALDDLATKIDGLAHGILESVRG